ncbi:polyketide synthase docking domain-containing protein [Actinomadura luzonensis]|uniref:polyketide synthase docking domain-containing protein n=1 Tax=Actinomadura luzonensis TaxID=2805427 RepID=UPI0038996205
MRTEDKLRDYLRRATVELAETRQRRPRRTARAGSSCPRCAGPRARTGWTTSGSS